MKTKKKFNHNKTPIYIPNQPGITVWGFEETPVATTKELFRQRKIQKELAKRGRK